MKTNNLSHVEYVAPKSINRNIELGNLYRIPSNYDEIKNNISLMGIITPLIVNSNDNTIVSGNLRHMIAIELDLPIIPVFFTKNVYCAEYPPNSEKSTRACRVKN